MIVIIRKLARLLEGCICPPSSDLSSKVHGTLSRRKRKSQNMSPKDAALVSAAASTVNKFADDGSSMSKILVKQNEDAGGSVGSYSNQEENVESHVGFAASHEEAEKVMVRQCFYFYLLLFHPNSNKESSFRSKRLRASRRSRVSEKFSVSFLDFTGLSPKRRRADLPLMKLKMSGVSQHSTKKLTDTSEKGLRGSISKDFPYFHVEFGLNRGFVHVIDDKKTCNLHLTEEDS
ncbi:hypothetical protein NC653_028057 [Populus alba x Populus x berolinensis]|uniref:Cwf19-like protein C-terminal domain-containing protein n=1 Tax=Populus alba x Populus x berolinensis TaxID=444605 RepID=A0AAD6M7W7_9ROSI|nr:hypothetical protein NC653_028057 [Populus alba x Populus x berolinensis]